MESHAIPHNQSGNDQMYKKQNNDAPSTWKVGKKGNFNCTDWHGPF